MRTALSVVLSTIGGLLLLVGGAAAFVVGPDDTATLPAGTTATVSGVALTASDLFPVRDVTLHVAARSAGGDVFLGSAHPVDARDYVRDVRARLVQRVGADGALSGRLLEGGLDAPSVVPTDADFWQRTSSGSGQRTLAVPLTGEPVSVVVVPLGGPAATTVAFGAVVPGAFVAALVAAALGLGLVVVAVRARRAGRRARPGAPTVGAAQQPSAVYHAERPAAPEIGVSPTRPATPLRRAAAHVGRRAAAFAALAAVTALAACAPLPSRVDAVGVPTRPAVTADELDAAVASYDERNNAVLASGTSGSEGVGWSGVDAGALLAAAEYDSAYDAAAGTPPAPVVVEHTTLASVVPTFAAYPLWFVVLGESTRDGEAEDGQVLRVLERDRVTDPWRASLSVRVADDAVTLAPSGTVSPTAAQESAALAALEDVRLHLETGSTPRVELGDLAPFRERVLATGDLEASLTVERAVVTPFGNPEDPTAPGGPVQVVRVDGGTLLVASLGYEFVRRVEPGWFLTLADPAVARITRQEGDLQNVRQHGVVQTVVLVPDEGTPRVVGGWWQTVLPPS